MTTTTVLATNLVNDDGTQGQQIALVLVNVTAVQPDGLSTLNSLVTMGTFVYRIAIPFASMITNVQTATIGTTV